MAGTSRSSRNLDYGSPNMRAFRKGLVLPATAQNLAAARVQGPQPPQGQDSAQRYHTTRDGRQFPTVANLIQWEEEQPTKSTRRRGALQSQPLEPASQTRRDGWTHIRRPC